MLASLIEMAFLVAEKERTPYDEAVCVVPNSLLAVSFCPFSTKNGPACLLAAYFLKAYSLLRLVM